MNIDKSLRREKEHPGPRKKFKADKYLTDKEKKKIEIDKKRKEKREQT